jgi:hypothetical protein
VNSSGIDNSGSPQEQPEFPDCEAMRLVGEDIVSLYELSLNTKPRSPKLKIKINHEEAEKSNKSISAKRKTAGPEASRRSFEKS